MLEGTETLQSTSLVGLINSWSDPFNFNSERKGKDKDIVFLMPFVLSLFPRFLKAPEWGSLIELCSCGMGRPAQQNVWICWIGHLFLLILESCSESFHPGVQGIWNPSKAGIWRECARRFLQCLNIVGNLDLVCLSRPSRKACHWPVSAEEK